MALMAVALRLRGDGNDGDDANGNGGLIGIIFVCGVICDEDHMHLVKI
jgi:hypothetical protein